MLRRMLLAGAMVGAMVSAANAQSNVVYRVPVTGTIEMGIAPFIKRAISEAEAAGARAVILDVNTLGGRVDAALQIVDAISQATVPVYAFVDPRAISAGALISISTDSVFMVKDATLGASTVVDASGAKVSEKAQSVMRAQFRALAERRGIDPRIGEAMVDESIAIPDVVEAGKLLTLTASEAERVGYGIEVTGFSDVLARLGLSDAEVIRPHQNWAEGLVRFLSNPFVAPILLSLGVLGLIVEIKTPAFGMAGAVGLASLAAFFGSHFIIGLAGWEEVILLAAGLLLYPDGICRPRGWEEKDLGQYDRAEEVLAPHGCAAAYRKRMLDELGGFDEEYFAYLEDLDLGMRGRLLGWSCWYVPEAVVAHRKSATAGNYSEFKAYHVERNRIWNAIKLLPRFILFISPLFTINRYLLQGYAAATHRGLSGEFVKEYSYLQLAWILIRAYAAALWRLPSMLRKRRDISRRRRLTTEEWYGLISRFKLDAIELALKY